jgi:broad-specificity NMP kinase
MKIAVTGKMCSGKTTLCNYLCELEPRFQIFSFGKKVKDVASDLFNMDPQIKDRTLLTSIGQKMREINKDVWVNYVINQCKDVEYCLVDDLRYQNEYEALVKNGFKIIQLNISDELQEYRILNIYPNNYEDHLQNRNHPSEKNTFQWLNNDHPHLSIDSSEDREVIKKIVREFINLV